ncbi:MAG: hypothetical protein H8E48_14445 [Chloroflexi bacterium]|nr:hypothetical protein [Chloroflexota bacterium]
MPGLGGQGLYEIIKALRPELLNSIVFITGDTVNPATKSFLTSITDSVLSKPFAFRELEQLIVSVIDQKSDQESNVSSQKNPLPKSALSSGC